MHTTLVWSCMISLVPLACGCIIFPYGSHSTRCCFWHAHTAAAQECCRCATDVALPPYHKPAEKLQLFLQIAFVKPTLLHLGTTARDRPDVALDEEGHGAAASGGRLHEPHGGDVGKTACEEGSYQSQGARHAARKKQFVVDEKDILGVYLPMVSGAPVTPGVMYDTCLLDCCSWQAVQPLYSFHLCSGRAMHGCRPCRAWRALLPHRLYNNDASTCNSFTVPTFGRQLLRLHCRSNVLGIQGSCTFPSC